MKRILLVLMAVTLGLGIGFAGKAGAVPVAVNWTLQDAFNSATLSFTPFTANSILSFTGTGEVHTHNVAPGVTTPQPFTVDVRQGAVFVNVFSGIAPLTPGSLVLSSLGAIPFSAAVISGLRFATTIPGEFHDFTGEVITFNSPTEPPTPGVPEPATLLFLGSGLLGLIAFRARFK
jgi:hypothetical protein